MMKALMTVVLLGGIVVGLVGCRSAKPLQNIDNAIATSSETYDLRAVRTAILKAGIQLGWQMKEVEEGHILAILDLRSHHAEVDIVYDRENYTIIYKNSKNLKYKETAEGPVIHPNYNSWIKNLNRNIQAELIDL